MTKQRCSPGEALSTCYNYLLYKHTMYYTISYYIYLSQADTLEFDQVLEALRLYVPSSRIASVIDSPIARQSSARRIARI